MTDQPDHPSEQDVADAIPSVLSGLAERFRAEARESPLYAELAAQPSLERRLRLAHSKMEEVALMLADVLRDVDGVEMTRERYRLIQGLPRTKSEMEDFHRAETGYAGCVDKAFESIRFALLTDPEQETTPTS